MVKLFIGGHPLNMDELQLVQLVSPYGQVATIKMVRDRQTKKSKGYSFLEITDTEGAERIMEALQGTPYGDKELKINIVPPEEAAPARRPQRPGGFRAPTYAKVERHGSSSYGNDGNKPKRPRKQF
ncbi:RNA-binding protein [Mucilaginibacter sp. UR6-1]|uniref:RNA recognition motif domain-containing protein n=1 Tax=Mucilaginibacter sp. UR6-1 TaxID=1435643 RepID=UPI001E4240FE|nr:RNA-binding protein [Mucilaginibacter sp. UR6-1]MCC8408127.1 RNA-binding protein [Mucilaginibacter sp. UR6-1]